MAFGTALSVQLVITELGRADLEQLFDDLADALHSKESPDGPLLDSDVAMDFSTGRVEISVTAVAASAEASNRVADEMVTAALTETGGQDVGGEPLTVWVEDDLVGSDMTLPAGLSSPWSFHTAPYEVTRREPITV